MNYSNTYGFKSSDAKYNAQQNLQGRTHYVDDDTLRYHKSRVLSSGHCDNGLLFYIIESYAVDMYNTQRAMRPVVFDLFGHVVLSVDLDKGYKTSKQATKYIWDELNKIDAIQVNKESLESEKKYNEMVYRNVEELLQ